MTRRLVEDYVNGWKDKDVEKIVRPLADDCVVIESHGPTYRGKQMVREWAENWFNEGNKVNKWDIASFYETSDGCVFEWYFECIAGGKKYKIDGISIVKINNNQITHLREYRTTKPLFDWKREKLIYS